MGLQDVGFSHAGPSQARAIAGIRERLLMDFGWRFAFGHASDPSRDFRTGTSYFSYFAKAGYGDGAASKAFDDRSWRILDLPHDWAVELPFSPAAGYSHGYKAIGRQFPETSIGWYRKTFSVPASDLGRRISIEFDGVHRNSIVWVNGFFLGEEHSGYSGFRYDITDYLNHGGENVVAVRVDATMEEGWYYEGAGIYRHVWLVKTSPLHVASNGTFVASELTENAAVVTARTTIVNERLSKAVFDIDQTIVDTDEKTVSQIVEKQLTLKSGEENDFSCSMKVMNPRLWSIEDPHLYKLITRVRSGRSTADSTETPFGIRTIRFDPNEGFFLNGKHVYLKGTNNHQDHAGVGTAIPDALQEFRIMKLKEMGANAYRCSHNPPTPELLDVCDRLGMLVIDENRLMGTNEEHFNLLKRMVCRDRNHPSVFIWSIGNEEWAIEGTVIGARIASTMQAFVQRLDPTRRVIYPNSGWGHGISEVIDVMGFNYVFNGDVDRQHAAFPNQPSIGTEETTSRGTRGVYRDDTANAHMEATDRKPSGRSLETGFKFYAARPFLSGIFYWTGFDYRGEPNPCGWPQVSSQSGILDQCGFPKDMYFYLKSWWTDKPVLHIFPHWTWDEGKTISVWTYSNCDEVELFINERSLGRKAVQKYGHLEWSVAYEPGALHAGGYRDGKESVSEKVETTEEPATINLVPDRATINADGEDVSMMSVEIKDAHGRIVPTASNEISFTLEGPGRIIGVGNGDPSSHEPDKYIDRVNQVTIRNLKVAGVQQQGTYPETINGFDDSAWPSLLNNREEYEVKLGQGMQRVAIRGTFDLPDLGPNSVVTLWPKSLGEEQAVYVDGHLIAKNIKRDNAVEGYKLDRAILLNGKNIYAVVASPLVKRYQYDNLNTDPGIIQVFTPAEQWKRKVFNGLAQVIVQSRQQVGEVVLTAITPGISRGMLRIGLQGTAPRPAVPEK